jgi:serine/threonine protein kinase
MSSAATPTRIGPYEIVSRLGVGGMAETYVAVRRGPGAFAQRVCLKRLRPELEGDPEFVRQFMAEAAIAARMRHAAIAQVLDFGQDGGDYYLALELIEGCDLRQLLQAKGGALTPALVLHVATELATALDVAHRTDGGAKRDAVVHRDVSPSNTLVSTAGEVKLTDFGIARAMRSTQYTRTGIVKGKVPYMAPEYARSARLDPRSDLFSLGVLLYECACGTRPHDGATELETLERAGRGQRIPLADRAPALPSGLAEIVECLLEPDPELRYQTASGLLEALLALPAPSRARLELGALVTDVLRLSDASLDPSAGANAGSATEIMEQIGAAASVVPKRASSTVNPESSPDHGVTRQRGGLEGAAQAVEPSGAAVPRFAMSAVRVRAGRPALAALALALFCALSVLAFALLRRPAGDVATRDVAPGIAASPPEAEQATSVDEPAAILPSALAPMPALVVRPESSGRAPEPALPESAAANPAVPIRPPDDTTTTRAGKAWLEVIVVPYGDVSIDGRPMVRAPVTLAADPGEHTIEARGSRGDLLRRRVTLAPGQRKQVVLE